jgi:hypothetical protein
VLNVAVSGIDHHALVDKDAEQDAEDDYIASCCFIEAG